MIYTRIVQNSRININTDFLNTATILMFQCIYQRMKENNDERFKPVYMNSEQLTSWVAIDILTRYLFTAMIRFKIQNYRLTISKNHR